MKIKKQYIFLVFLAAMFGKAIANIDTYASKRSQAHFENCKRYFADVFQANVSPKINNLDAYNEFINKKEDILKFFDPEIFSQCVNNFPPEDLFYYAAEETFEKNSYAAILAKELEMEERDKNKLISVQRRERMIQEEVEGFYRKICLAHEQFLKNSDNEAVQGNSWNQAFTLSIKENGETKKVVSTLCDEFQKSVHFCFNGDELLMQRELYKYAQKQHSPLLPWIVTLNDTQQLKEQEQHYLKERNKMQWKEILGMIGGIIVGQFFLGTYFHVFMRQRK